MTNRELELIAARGRRLGMEMVYRAASGHIGALCPQWTFLRSSILRSLT